MLAFAVAILLSPADLKPQEASPDLPLVHVPCAGTPRERGEALRQAVEKASRGVTLLLGPCEYLLEAVVENDYDYRSDTPYHSGLRIEGKSDLTIRGAGQGRSTVKLAREVYLGIEIRSGTTGLTISQLTLAGSILQPLCVESRDLENCYGGRASERPNTHGIASSGRTAGVRDVRLEGLEVRDLAIGISVGSSGSGFCGYESVTIEGNHVHDIRGTYSGSGYGIHVGCAAGVAVRDNVIERAGRHSVYVGRTSTPNAEGTTIARNTVIDHGNGEAMSPKAAAIAVARSDNVAVLENTVVRSQTHGISVEFDPETGLDCTRCVVTGNKFVGDGDLADIWVNARSPVWLRSNARGPGRRATVADDSGMARLVD